jgi:hypothetical protein
MLTNLLWLTFLLAGGAFGVWRAMRKPAFVSLSNDEKPVMERDATL